MSETDNSGDFEGTSRLTPIDWQEAAYLWLSPDALLILRPVTAPGCLGTNPLARLFVRGLLPGPLASLRITPTIYTAHRYEISTGKETALPDFNRQYSQELRAWGNDRPPQLTISPDGQRWLWSLRTRQWRAATWDGSETVDWPESPHGGPATWLRDSHRWVEVISDWSGERPVIPALRLRRCSDPNSERIITVSSLDMGEIVGTTARNSLLLHHRMAYYTAEPPANLQPKISRTEIAFSEVDLEGAEVTARRFTVPLPEPGTIYEVCVSQDGTHLLWIIQPLDEEQWIHGPYSLWTSDLDGAEFQAVGRLWDSQLASSSNFHYLQWSPDGRRVGYFYHDTLYTVYVAAT